MIRKLPSGLYRLYSRKRNPKTGKRCNLGTFRTRTEALQHERAIQSRFQALLTQTIGGKRLIRIKATQTWSAHAPN